jgi:hypothetical protein
MADRHILDHPPAKRAHRSHREAPVSRGMHVNNHILTGRRLLVSCPPVPDQPRLPRRELVQSAARPTQVARVLGRGLA